MGQSGSDNNIEMLTLIKNIGDTPGFRLADAKSGNFKAVRMVLDHKGHHVGEASKTLSIRTAQNHFKDRVNQVRDGLGWTAELHADLAEIARQHRISGTDSTEDICDRLLTAFIPGWDTPVPEPVVETAEERRERVRHDKMKAQQTTNPKAGQATPGMSTAPVQTISGAGVIRAEHISPERALDLLATIADYQRKLKPEKVKDFMGKMERGEWALLASDPVCIDTNGRLCNGQHRLEAVYQLEIGQDFYVAYDVDPATYDKMDRGTRRTTADMLHGKRRVEGTTRKEVSDSSLSALLKVLYLWENFPQDEWAAKQRDVREPEVMAAYEGHPQAEESVVHARLAKIKIRPTASMFAHYLICHRHEFDPASVELVNRWFEEIRKPRLIRPGDPAFALREWFLGGEMDRVANRKSLPTKFDEMLLQTYLILRVWDNTTIGKPMLRLSWKPDFEIKLAARITDRISFPPAS
jgi:hypothetical protein